MKKITLLLFVLIASVGFSQDLVLGFEAGESGGVNGATFGGMPAPTVMAGTGSNTSQVLEIVGNTAGEPWQGVNLNLTTNVNLSSTQTMTIDVKSATAITFLVKVNGGLSGAPAAAAEVTHNGDDTWQTLAFTFDTALDGQAAMANGIYSAFVIHAYWEAGEVTFFPGGSPIATPARTFYVDNIKGPADTCSNGIQDGDETGVDCGGSCPNVCSQPPTVAAPTPPTRAAADVVSIYSDKYAAIPAINLDAGWCGADAVTATTAGGNAVLAYNDRDCQGIDFDANQQDITGLTHIHVDLFIQTGTDLVGKVFNLKAVGPSGTGSDDTIIPIDINALSPAPVPGTWYSFDLEVAFTHPTMRQFAITSNLKNVVWYDNLYLHKNTTLGIEGNQLAKFKLYPNPTQDSWNIRSQSAIITSIRVYDVLGKNVLSIAPNKNETTINGSLLKPGMYFAKINTPNGQESLKLVKK
ncbi:T9SS type A sorting domain-containing protein [Aestuariivivens sediminis]|uniref:T9SS type A sorting domain-containing protein n=1 Tax=Aestuariivivens sediminis TaxID=2913557 RepID=UPI001F5603E2|nr:T9SS type A sorting domain-containing protein [Aestuariivivens sediminis]